MTVAEMHSAAPAIPQAPRREQTARARHLRVAQVARRQRRARVAVWGTALVTAVALFVLVAFHVVAVQQAFSLDRLAEQREAEELRYERLRTEVAMLSSSEAIADAAERLGMGPPQAPVEYIDAPAAAPQAAGTDRTSDTLGDVHGEAKQSLDP
jgi:cell division protein FtsL